MKPNDWHKKMKRENTPSNDGVYEGTMEIDRVQSARDPAANIHTTLDRIVHIDRVGEGAVVTFGHGPAESVELYTVAYDVIITNMGYTSSSIGPASERPAGSAPSVQDMIGDMKMEPAKDSEAPVTADQSTGHVRVLGVSAAEAINVSTDKGESKRSGSGELKERRNIVEKQVSADSPDDRVIEGVGISIRDANQRKEE
ncbi:MAG: hypothetical protein ABI678_12340, partial [Kofleriaceae bacterium]